MSAILVHNTEELMKMESETQAENGRFKSDRVMVTEYSIVISGTVMDEDVSPVDHNNSRGQPIPEVVIVALRVTESSVGPHMESILTLSPG